MTAYGVVMRVLVSGGAGYIGSHTVVQLVAAGHEVVVVDDFGNAKPAVMGRLDALTGTHIPVQAFDLTDKDKTERLFATTQIDAVIHFAGLKAVGESVQIPLDYYENNLESTFSLLRAMRRHGCRTLVFSSSATVYGDRAPVPCRARAAQNRCHGGLLAVSRRPFYAHYIGRAAAFGLDPVTDQRLGGTIMWVPGDFIFLAAASLAFFHWLASEEQAQRLREHRSP